MATEKRVEFVPFVAEVRRGPDFATSTDVFGKLDVIVEGDGAAVACPSCGALNARGELKPVEMNCRSCGKALLVREARELLGSLAYLTPDAIADEVQAVVNECKGAMARSAASGASQGLARPVPKKDSFSFAEEGTLSEVARRIRAGGFYGALYLATHHGRFFLGSSSDRFCPICGDELKADLYATAVEPEAEANPVPENVSQESVAAESEAR